MRFPYLWFVLICPQWFALIGIVLGRGQQIIKALHSVEDHVWKLDSAILQLDPLNFSTLLELANIWIQSPAVMQRAVVQIEDSGKVGIFSARKVGRAGKSLLQAVETMMNDLVARRDTMVKLHAAEVVLKGLTGHQSHSESLTDAVMRKLPWAARLGSSSHSKRVSKAIRRAITAYQQALLIQKTNEVRSKSSRPKKPSFNTSGLLNRPQKTLKPKDGHPKSVITPVKFKNSQTSSMTKIFNFKGFPGSGPTKTRAWAPSPRRSHEATSSPAHRPILHFSSNTATIFPDAQSKVHSGRLTRNAVASSLANHSSEDDNNNNNKDEDEDDDEDEDEDPGDGDGDGDQYMVRDKPNGLPEITLNNPIKTGFFHEQEVSYPLQTAPHTSSAEVNFASGLDPTHFTNYFISLSPTASPHEASPNLATTSAAELELQSSPETSGRTPTPEPDLPSVNSDENGGGVENHQTELQHTDQEGEMDGGDPTPSSSGETISIPAVGSDSDQDEVENEDEEDYVLEDVLNEEYEFSDLLDSDYRVMKPKIPIPGEGSGLIHPAPDTKIDSENGRQPVTEDVQQNQGTNLPSQTGTPGGDSADILPTMNIPADEVFRKLGLDMPTPCVVVIPLATSTYFPGR